LLFFFLLLLPWVVLEPVGLGAATTGAGEDVVTGGGEEWVVTGGALVVAGACELDALVATGLALCAAALWWIGALCVVVFTVVVCAAWVAVVGGVDAAGVELVCEPDVPPHPAATRAAAAIELINAFFMLPIP
jgi:hypothetical protein